ncbi:MAG: hypothetical protein WCJ35_02410, partial [Planctomycetota bacterium]
MNGSILRGLVRVCVVAALASLGFSNAFAEDWAPLWSTANLSQARSDISATSAGGKVLFGGNPQNSSSVVDIYDSSAGTWSVANLS